MERKSIYKISQSEYDGYDSYDSAIVIAISPFRARNTCPWSGEQMTNECWSNNTGKWATSIDNVECVEIGTAILSLPSGLVLSSYNAG